MPAEVFVENGMKQPSPQIESFVFNLGNASKLRCTGDNKTVCGQCEGCLLRLEANKVRTWLPKAGDQSKKRFVLGLIRRLHSVDLVQHVVNLLQPLLCKDFMYARSRAKPSLISDTPTMSNDRALDVVQLEKNVATTWDWFEKTNYWTKSNFLTQVLQGCEAHLLYTVGIQAKTLLSTEFNAFHPIDEYEAESVADTVHSYESNQNCELDLLTTTCRKYSILPKNPFVEDDDKSEIETNFDSRMGGAGTVSRFGDEIFNDDSGDESLDSIFEEVDPTCLVVAGSAKAHSGVSRYKDFIRELPVHLSKYILGFLDKVSLHNCVCVSKKWRTLTEEVHKEFYISQHLQEEVMLMQGASAQGCNPVYANDIDVTVPNIDFVTKEAIRTGEEEIQTTFKTEVSFATAYSGYSTREIIMEERNVYCGAYNVMVLIDEQDTSRVIHTSGGRLIAMGSTDRRVVLVDTETGHTVEPSITGHAGSIRCVTLDEQRGFVISGSYDTSIRMWSLETGKPQRIFRGHRDTVLCTELCGNLMASGGKDNTCRVWELDQKKPICTFKHRHPVTAVAISSEMCLSGCEAGKVKVWDLKTGKLIKMLRGHHGPVTAIKFDVWHIVTGSKDGYVLSWSTQGNHKRCLSALRHPKEVLSLAFMYLRIITAAADGKVRIWNMITGQCLRIMRGNSRSDPILQLIAIDNRITINTGRNLLVLNFEPVEFDYTLENDKMPPLVQYSKYSDAPVRQQPYAYIRANRMKSAGATNTKIIYHNGSKPPEVYYNNQKRADQTLHSSKGLSEKFIKSAKRIQSASGRLENTDMHTTAAESMYPATTAGETREDFESRAQDNMSEFRSVVAPSMRSSVRSKPPIAPSRVSKSRAGFSTTRSGSASVVSIGGFQIGRGLDDDSSVMSEGSDDQRRRVSWGFEQPVIPSASHIGLTETKSVLRSQIRTKGDVVPPDFVYLTVNAIHSKMKPTHAIKNIDEANREKELSVPRRLGRPNSSPSRIDKRTRVPIEEVGWEEFLLDSGIPPKEVDMKSEVGSHISGATSVHSKKTQVEAEPQVTKIVTEFAPVSVEAKPHLSLYNERVKSSIPKGRVLRPHTAKVYRENKSMAKHDSRPKSAVITMRPGVLSGTASRTGSRPTTAHTRPGTAKTGAAYSSSSGASTEVNTALHGKKTPGQTTSCTQPSFVPMLMYSPDVKNRIAEIRNERIQKQGYTTIKLLDENGVGGQVSEFNNPMRNHVDFKLRTHEQTVSHIKEVKDSFHDNRSKKKEEFERKQRAAWLAKVKGQLDMSYVKKPNSLAPEIREYGEAQSVI